MAFPPPVLASTDLGGVAVRDLVRTSRTAEWSLIRSSSSLREALDEAARGEDVALGALQDGHFRRGWHRRNSITVMLRVEQIDLEHFDRISAIPGDSAGQIDRAIGATEEARRRELDTVLLRRMRRWDADTPEALMGALFSFVKIKPPPELVCTILRTALYGWCTSSRFRSGQNGCLLHCGAAESDCQTHYVRCPRWQAWATNLLRVGEIVLHGTTSALLRSHAMPLSVSLRVSAALDFALFAVDKARHGATENPDMLMSSRLQEMVRRHSARRAVVVREARRV